MSRFRSSLNLRAILVLTILVLGGALFAFAATSTKEALITPEDQARIDRDISKLPSDSACTVSSNKELFITNRSVVDDCWRTKWGSNCATPPVAPARKGAWTVGGLLPGIFGTNDPAELSDLTLRWFREWESLQTINSDPVAARPTIRDLVVDPWLAASGGVQLDMKKAPFRLLAIVSRLDLRQNAGYSEGFSAGEARFVFNVLDEEGLPTQFNIIFEYELEADDCADILAWANDWHDLGVFTFGDDHNAALDALTHRFTKIGASPAKLNGSAIKQVRTNEVELASPWEMREFHLKGSALPPAPLVQRTVALTPARSRNGSTQLADFINTNTAAILTGSHTVPLSFQQQPFRGGASPHKLELGWDGPGPVCSSIYDPEARHKFSLNTCSGCHGDETGVVFKHVEPRDATSASALSTFLTGGTATDRCGLTHTFGDISRRRVDLCQLLNKTCTEINQEPVITSVH